MGAYGDSSTNYDAGGAYVYDLAGPKPTVPFLSLTNPVSTNLYYAWAVAISSNKVIVGSSDSSERAYVYDLATATPGVPVLTLTNPAPAPADNFGEAFAISGSLLVVGADGDEAGDMKAGSVYIYDLAGGTPTVPSLTITNPSPAHLDQFGNAVAISGTRVVIGAPHDDAGALETGIAYVYDLASATPTVPTVVLTNPTPLQFDYFGRTVGISGTRAIVGSPRERVGTNEAGAVYVYDVAGPNPSVPALTLTNPAPAPFGAFGASVSISGSRLIVGAPGNSIGATHTGNAFVYDLANSSPTMPVAPLVNPTSGAHDAFGNSVALAGGLAIIGAPYNDTGAQGRGAAFVFATRPGLQMVRKAPGKATISWTSALPGFVLQQSDSLKPANWVNARSGTNNPASVITTPASRFYRLNKPLLDDE